MKTPPLQKETLQNERARAYLDGILASGNVAHLLLFVGEDEAVINEASVFAKRWLEKISPQNVSHLTLDIHHLKVEGKIGMHSVASIREMLEKAANLPFQANGKVFIIEEAERMLPTSANALLKTIEEPSANTLFLLTTNDPLKLLPTVRSRCQVVRFLQKHAEDGPYYATLHKLISSTMTYKTIFSFCDEIQAIFDGKRKTFEAEVVMPSKELQKEFNAQQKHKIELEGEGHISSKMQHEVELLLQDIAKVFRDEYRKHGKGPNLEKVQEGLVFTKLAYERSVPLKNALESFFLRILEQ